MENSNIWLIDHKATLGDDSPHNIDGSSWILGLVVLCAPDKASAMERFEDYLASNDMELIELFNIQAYSDNVPTNDTELNADIERAVLSIQEEDKVFYLNGRTSETIEYLGGLSDDE